jgi:uncharacterized protein (TIGR00255 family)
MIRSMTGFGDASAQAHGVQFFLELRSLNNKYFKTNIRLPEEFQALEPEIESQLRKRLTRGTITATLKYSDTSAAAAYTVNHEALTSYVEQVRRSSAVSDGLVALDLGALLALPGVLQQPTDDEERFDRTRDVTRKLLDEACAHLISMREREGAFLVEDLLKHHSAIARELKVIAERAPLVVRDHEKRLRQRVEALMQDAQLRAEPVELIREVAVYAEKSDIAEEIARLTAHLDQFQEMLRNGEDRPIGRTMDFLTQEMLREANTIASKSGDAEISRAIVEIKGAIDRIKEQVQNVE